MTVNQRKQMQWAVATAAFMTTAALSDVAAPQARAQAPGGAPQARTSAQIEKEIGVTAAQHTRIESIKKKYDPKLKGLQPRMVAAQKQMQQIQKEYITIAQAANKEMESVLTPAQRTKLKAMQAADAKRYQQMMQQQGGRPGGGR